LKIASYNVNGVNGRLENLIRWLDEASPDIVCLQELKAPQTKFPIKAIEASGYGAVWLGQKSWNGVAILAKGNEPHLTRRRLPGDSKDDQSRYIEAIVDGTLIGCLYAPNGNPYPGSKFNYKLRWLKRLRDYAADLLEFNVSSILVGDYNVMPTELDVYKPERWKTDALFAPEAKEKFRELVAEGWTDAIHHLHPDERIFTFWHYWRNSFERDAGIRIDHLLLSPTLAPKLKAAGVDRTPRGWDKTSDHAPAWVELRL